MNSKVSYDLQGKFAASSQNSLADWISENQTVARFNLGPEVAECFSELSLAALVAVRKFSDMWCCLNKCFEKH